MTSDLTSALELSHIMSYTSRRMLYFTLHMCIVQVMKPFTLGSSRSP